MVLIFVSEAGSVRESIDYGGFEGIPVCYSR